MASNTQPISGSMTEPSAAAAVEAEAQKAASKETPILKAAWERYAQLNTMSRRRSKSFRWLRVAIAALGILATLLAILTDLAAREQGWLQQQPFFVQYRVGIEQVLRVFFIAVPIIASLLAAFGSRAFRNGDWLITRAAAEEYLKEIYLYRTDRQKRKKGERKNRAEILVDRLYDIQDRLYRALGGELTLAPYKGRVPPYYDPKDPESDNGYDDLDGEAYFRLRLKDQLDWHQKRVNDYQRERERVTWFILLAGGIGSFFAAWGQSLSIWVALTASIAAAFIGWQELRNIDAIIRNYSKVVVELTRIQDEWLALKPDERKPKKFHNMVDETEEVLWSQHQAYIRSQQQAVQEALETDEELDTLESTMEDEIRDSADKVLKGSKRAVPAPIKEALVSAAAEASAGAVEPKLEAMGQVVADAAETMQEHASAMSEDLQGVSEDLAEFEVDGGSSEETSDVPASYSDSEESEEAAG
jgi:hypothetical protein